MKTILLLAVLGVVGGVLVGARENLSNTDPHRFIIYHNGKAGFINSRGEIVITPRFERVQEYSESLCAARVNGRYGFIDVNGEWVIDPKYDYATQFENGLTIVYINGQPMVINKKGTVLFDPFAYTEIYPPENGFCRVKTHSGKFGTVNLQGNIIADTACSWISEFYDGIAIAYGPQDGKSDANDKPIHEETLIDHAGRMLFPYGMLIEIRRPGEGYFIAKMKRGNDDYWNVVGDRNGKITFKLPENPSGWFDSGVNNGIVRAFRYSNKKSNDDSWREYYTAHGVRIFRDKKIRWGRDFAEGRAFLEDKDRRFSLIDTQGKLIADAAYTGAYDFSGGFALVRTSKWGVIDTLGNFVVPPTFDDVLDAGIVNGYFFPRASTSPTSTYRDYVGVADVKGNVISEPIFDYVDPRGFVDGLLRVWKGNRFGYINKEGKMVWEGDANISNPKSVNIDYMKRGHFYAEFFTTGHGGPGQYETAVPINTSTKNANTGLQVSATNVRDTADCVFISVANVSDSAVYFNAQDNRLYMKIQALDLSGEWRDIEYLPSSWCGNSYHTVRLPGNHAWKFNRLNYEGCMKTSLRVELKYIDPYSLEFRSDGTAHRSRKEFLVYSNVYEGSVNPSQFWRKPEYSPWGIMDPYND